MYYVYEITFPKGEKYVGCTNDLKRRKDQHNENARKQKSKLGIYLQDNSIILKEEDLKVIATFINRHDALEYERKTTYGYDKSGYQLLNDNYTKECSRKGKHSTAFMEYYVVDLEKETCTYTNNLKRYATDVLGIEYRDLQRTTKKGYTQERYKAYHKDRWLDLENKEYYLSKQSMVDERANIQENSKVRKSKSYLVRLPNGETQIIRNADQFAKDHNLTTGTFHATYIKHKPTKGYEILKRL